MTRTQFLALVGSLAQAVEYETQVLSIGDGFLPTVARQVRDGGKPTPAYWAWLAEQWEGEELDAEQRADAEETRSEMSGDDGPRTQEGR